MVHTPRTVRASSGRFTKSPIESSTTASTNTIKSTPLHAHHISRSNTGHSGSPSNHGNASNPDITNRVGPVDSDNSKWQQTTLPFVGRPPTRISLQPSGELHQITNGVVTDIQLHNEDVATAAGASAAAFDRAITKEKTPVPTDKDKRVLRSQGPSSSRANSSLARFFPDFEEVVSGQARESDALTAESILFVFESKTRTANTSAQSPTKVEKQEVETEVIVSSYVGDIKTEDRHVGRLSSDAINMDFTAYQAQAFQYTDDPLADATYLQAHRRGERKEKQLRNIEKDHALHEKADLERLLDDIRGPDWLKYMGVAGVTEAEKKRYEPYRAQYIERMQALLDKFRMWKEQEKELKLRRDGLLAADEEEREESEDTEAVQDENNHFNNGDIVDPSARQLQLEAKLALSGPPRFTPRVSTKIYMPVPEPEPVTPFQSFYSTPDFRAAAMGVHHSHETATAFGQPIPDFCDIEFTLPEDYVTEEIVISNARKRRRMRREIFSDASTSKK